MKISVNAYAKINLFLDIDSLRPDGYHNIISYMHSIDLYDTVTVELTESKSKEIRIFCDNAEIPCDSSNLAYKAANIFPNINAKISIFIKKRIPMSAGLAGGSADAAATLIALNRLLSEPLSTEELKSLGNKLGADVPFCIEKGARIARGTGEILERTVSMPVLPMIIAKMGDGMSTPSAYKMLDDKYDKFINYEPQINKLNILTSDSAHQDERFLEGTFNIFESVVEPIRPNVTLLKKTMTECGAICSMMSGSGTSVFGIFKDEATAEIAQITLRSKGADTYLCYPYI